MAPLVTAADVAGTPVPVATPHPALDRDDECNACGQRLYRVAGGRAWLADCGRYCSRECLDRDAADLAALMNQHRADDA